MGSVSVIIPAFNAAIWLEDCLGSLLSQRDVTFEIVVVDDGSTDDSAVLLARLAARDARLCVISQTNQGVAAARNNGLRAAKGDYVWFVDADDRVRENALASLVERIESYQADVAIINAHRFGDGIAPAPIFSESIADTPLHGEECLQRFIIEKRFHHFPWLFFTRREWLLGQGLWFPEGLVHEDVVWATSLLLAAPRVCVLDQLLYEYRIHPASITGAQSDASVMRRIESYFSVIPLLVEQRNGKNLEAQTRRLLDGEIIGQAYQVEKLRSQLANPVLRKEVSERCKRQRFWQNLWPLAHHFKRRRQLAGAIWRQLLSTIGP